jgi:hypothetical protein
MEASSNHFPASVPKTWGDLRIAPVSEPRGAPLEPTPTRAESDATLHARLRFATRPAAVHPHAKNVETR